MSVGSENRWWNASVLVLLLGVSFFMFSRSYEDPDLWGHVKFGEDLIQTGSLYQSDPYSFLTGDVPWINHEWVSEVVFYLSFELLGTSGLILLKTVAGVFLVWLLYGHLRRCGLDAVQAGILVLASNLFLLGGLIVIRPQLFTYIFFALTLIVIYRAEAGRTPLLWALPVIFALWINFHGGVLAGVAVVLIWYGVHFADLVWRQRTAWVLFSSKSLLIHLAIFASLAALLANPYGIALVEFLLRTATVPRYDIIEWVPLRLAGQHGIVYLIFVAVAVWGILCSRRERRPAMMALFVCIALLPLIAIRHLPLFAVAVFILAGEHIVDAWNRLPVSRSAFAESGRFEGSQRWLTRMNFLGAFIALIGAFTHFPCIEMRGSRTPTAGVELLEQIDARGNMVVHFDWGEYVIWHLGPKVKVSMDGRRETVYSEEILQQSRNFHRGLNDWDAILENKDTSMALVSKKFAAFNFMKLKSGWILAHEDEVSGLFVRKDSPLLERIRGATLPTAEAPACFP